jgi:hypothetical protein
MISSVVIEELLKEVASNDPGAVCVAYVYCDYRDAEKQTPPHIIGALLSQVIATPHYGTIKSLEARHGKGNPLELNEVCGFLSHALKTFHRAYICIDALDECKDEYRKRMLESLGSLLQDSTTNSSLRLFLTGRPHVEAHVNINISDLDNQPPLSMTLKAGPDDIRAYISRQLEADDYKEDCMNEGLKKEILEKIVDTSDGMFA